MIADGIHSFFTTYATEEAAHAIASLLSPSTALDIIDVTLVSEDFESDIAALNQLDSVVKSITPLLGIPEIEEKFNPLYFPSKIEAVDELLDINMKNDAMRFTGFDNNPFTIKQINVSADGANVLIGRAIYHPFDLPSYADIVTAHEHCLSS